MAIQEDLQQEDRSELRASEGAGSSRAEIKLPLYEVRKCPYLAGRPPCGTHHLFPSGANVCWAKAGDAKSYLGISREAQDRHCFGGPEGQDSCEQYRAAVDGGVPLPQFQRPPAGVASGPEWVIPPPSKPRRRPGVPSPLRSHMPWLIPLTLTVLLMLLLLR
jgi:hypothetical protein